MMDPNHKTKALIYCRVSSEKQKSEGHGLDSQEHRCREYAGNKGYEVEKVFQDSVTGGGDFMKRPAMRALLEYLDEKEHNQYVIIFDDLKRFARDTIFHLKLRQELTARNARVECLNFTFENTPEGEFIETILAAQGELERKQNRRQVIQKQKARLERGYWAFNSPPGYKMIRHPDHGKLLVPDEPKAGIIMETLKGFASGRFQEQVDVQRFLQKKDYCDGRPVYLDKVKHLLTRIIYSGYIEYPKWEVSRRKGFHQPLISLEIYEKIQEKLKGKARLRTRKDINEDFPLRGFVLCFSCRRPYTAGWCKGRNNKFPYYRCNSKECEERNKSIRKDALEAEFELILKRISSSENALRLTKVLFLKHWQEKTDNLENIQKQWQKQLAVVREEIQNLVQLAGKARNEQVLKVYEGRIETLTNKELMLQEKVNNPQAPRNDFEPAMDRVFEFLKNPYCYWTNGGLKEKRLVLKTVFSEQAVYDRISGFEPPNSPLPIWLFGQFNASNSRCVDNESDFLNRDFVDFGDFIRKNWEALEEYIWGGYEMLKDMKSLSEAG